MGFDSFHMGDIESEYDEIFIDDVIRETDNALLIRSDFGYDITPEEHWVPRSVIEDIDEKQINVGFDGFAYVKRWWVKKTFE